MGRAACLVSCLAAAAASAGDDEAPGWRLPDAFLEGCALGTEPSCEAIMASTPPPTFDVDVVTTAGTFTVHVVTAWAPPFATRFYILSLLGYGAGGPLYRVLHAPNTTTPPFVAQFGYRASPGVDAAWLAHQLSNETWPVTPQGNAVGTVAFGTNEVRNSGGNPACTAALCSEGFAVELFVNLAHNPRLDAADFSVFGWIDAPGMAVLSSVYGGYGECADLCASEGSAGRDDPFCVWDPAVGAYKGVNLTRMLEEGRGYVEDGFPLLDWVLDVVVRGGGGGATPPPTAGAGPRGRYPPLWANE